MWPKPDPNDAPSAIGLELKGVVGKLDSSPHTMIRNSRYRCKTAKSFVCLPPKYIDDMKFSGPRNCNDQIIGEFQKVFGAFKIKNNGMNQTTLEMGRSFVIK